MYPSLQVQPVEARLVPSALSMLEHKVSVQAFVAVSLKEYMAEEEPEACSRVMVAAEAWLSAGAVHS